MVLYTIFIVIAYEEKISEWELNISKLKADIIARDERRVNLSKQHANNRANIDRYVLIHIYASSCALFMTFHIMLQLCSFSVL